MPATSLIPKNGAVAYGNYVADYASFDIDVTQAVDNTTPYGTNVCAKHTGSGTPAFQFNIGAFALAHTTSTQPNLPSTNTIFTSLGATCTLTLDTGCTETFTGIVERFRIGHARMRGFVPIGITLRNSGEVTEAWATS